MLNYIAEDFQIFKNYHGFSFLVTDAAGYTNEVTVDAGNDRHGWMLYTCGKEGEIPPVELVEATLNIVQALPQLANNKQLALINGAFAYAVTSFLTIKGIDVNSQEAVDWIKQISNQFITAATEAKLAA